MDMFLAASKQTIVTTPFVGFERCAVVCEMIHYTEGIGTERAFLLAPYENTRVAKPLSAPLLCCAVQNPQRITPMSKEQVALWFDVLVDCIEGNDEATQVISKPKICEARSTLQELSEDTPFQHGSLVKLSDNIGVILGNPSVSNAHSDFTLTISGTTLRPLSMEFIGFSGSDDRMTATFDVDSMERSQLERIRLLDDVRIQINSEHAYTGVCTKVELQHGLLVVSVDSFAHGMRRSKINHLSTVAMTPLDLVHFVARNGGLGDNQLNIQGFERHVKAFRITVPVLNLTVATPVGFGDVTLDPPGYDLDDIRRITETGTDSADYFTLNSLAVVNVEAETLYDAWKSGVSLIQQALDVLLHILRSDTLFRGVSDDMVLSSWELDNLAPKPLLSSWVCVEQLFSGGRLVMDTSRMDLPQLIVIGNAEQRLLDQMQWYEWLAREALESGDQDVRNLFSALKWLRRSWDTDDPEDKIIFANIALEFVASGEPSPPVIPQEFIKRVRRAAVDKFKEIYNGPDKDKFVAKLNEKLGFALKTAPLRVQIDGFVQREKPPLTSDDIRIIFAGREIRNDLVHGRGAKATFSSTENRKMVNAIGMMTAYKLKARYREEHE